MRRLYPLLSGLAVIALVLTGAPAFGQGSTTPPRLIFQASIPGLNLSKFPDIAAAGRTVHIATNDNRTDPVYLSKPDSSQTFGNLEDLGDAPGQADFSPVSIATEADGTVHVAWINQQTRQLLYRSKAPGGSFGPQRVILTSGGFPASINLAVASDGALYVAWRLADQPHRVIRSTNDGASWSSQIQLGTRPGVNFPFIATGPSGQVAVAFTSSEGDFLQIFVGIWNGSTFDVQRITTQGSNYADPSAAYDTDGNLFVAYRGIEGDSGNGVWLGTFQGGTTWQLNRVTIPSVVHDMVNIQSDAAGNLHLAWIATVSGQQQVFYTFRPKGGTFSSIVAAPNPGGAIFNPRLAANVGDEAYGHVVSEFFQGDGSTTSIRYFLFGATSAPTIGADPVIEDGDTTTERETAVQVSFTNVSGQPTQIRWRWGAAPDDTTNDSAGWQTFSNPMNITVPARVLDTATCTPVTLYTQVREADGDIGGAQTDQIIFDVGITASVRAINPYSQARAGIFDPVVTTAGLTVTTGLGEIGLADFGTDGASDGDPGYTRVPGAYVEVRGSGDCSGLKNFSSGRSVTSFGKAISVTNETFANVLPYPGVIAVGPNQMVLRVSDKVGNFTDYAQSLVYDPAKPILSASAADSLTATSNPSATILARLNVKSVSVTDTYPGRGFWGVWVANSRTAVANPATDTSLRWAPLAAPGSSTTFGVDWSLGFGLSSTQVTTGTYYVYMRFLDGAGNATDGVISTTLTLNEVTRPRALLPFARR